MRDNILYLTIAVGVVVGIYSWATANPDAPFPTLILWFIANTGFVFGALLLSSKRLWRHRRFWVIVALMFLLHSAGFFTLIYLVPSTPLFWLALSTGFEYWLLHEAIERSCGRHRFDVIR